MLGGTSLLRNRRNSRGPIFHARPPKREIVTQIGYASRLPPGRQAKPSEAILLPFLAENRKNVFPDDTEVMAWDCLQRAPCTINSVLRFCCKVQSQSVALAKPGASCAAAPLGIQTAQGTVVTLCVIFFLPFSLPVRSACRLVRCSPAKTLLFQTRLTRRRQPTLPSRRKRRP